MSSVTHNRVYLSPDKPFLTFETLIPYMVDSTAGLNITFTPADISGGSPVTVFHQLPAGFFRSEEHTSELQSLMRISYAVFCLKKKKQKKIISSAEHVNTNTTGHDNTI